MSENAPPNFGDTEDLEGLDPNRYRCAELFARGEPVFAISLYLGVHYKTVRRWLNDPQVRLLVRRIRTTDLSALAGLAQEGVDLCLKRMAELVANDDPRVALAAAKTRIDALLKLRAFVEYDERLRVVEERLGIGRSEGAAT